ncbi:hypothetical protein [Nonomuraea jiangxiensis]|uniref:Uncharacterized protein n=1 Tax=Nonomuraea jiangxiensis TaxID=633440 RepID=A0A1G9RCG8_9ACTN|nr:hypothetical protein [Nonomuraea jiangxiensis]SDM20135.1 hypothetical protein SAMN05421869_13819 [Nonomuraea jiangxiensis]
MKTRVLTAIAVLALAGLPPIILDGLTSEPPLVEVEAWIQHVNVLTS